MVSARVVDTRRNNLTHNPGRFCTCNPWREWDFRPACRVWGKRAGWTKTRDQEIGEIGFWGLLQTCSTAALAGDPRRALVVCRHTKRVTEGVGDRGTMGVGWGWGWGWKWGVVMTERHIGSAASCSPVLLCCPRCCPPAVLSRPREPDRDAPHPAAPHIGIPQHRTCIQCCPRLGVLPPQALRALGFHLMPGLPACLPACLSLPSIAPSSLSSVLDPR